MYQVGLADLLQESDLQWAHMSLLYHQYLAVVIMLVLAWKEVD